MEELDEFGIPIKKTSTPQSAKIEMDEFGIPLKKKEPAIGLGYEKPSEALRMGGLPKQEKLSQSPLKTAAITTPSVSTKKQWTQQDQKSLIEKIKTGDLTGQTPEEDDYLSRIGSRIVRGMNTLNYNLSKTPEFVYNLAAYPQNVIAETFDIPALAVSADKVKKELGIQNEVADYYKDQINQLASLDDKYMGANGSVTNLAKEGKYLDAAKLLGEQIAESLPTTAAIAASGGLGASSTAITLGGGAVFGAAKYDELADRTDLTESQKTSISFATGLTEGLFENLGTGNIGRIVKDVITKQGAAKGKEVAKGMFITAYKDALKKYMPVSGALQGGIEEAATTFAQNAIDIYTGVDPQKKLSDGLIDAFAVGTGSDFIISSPVLLSKDRNKKVAEKQVEVDEIDSEINNPNLSDDAKATLSQKRGKIMSDINDVIDEDVNEQRALPDATKREIEQIQDGLEQIGIDIENTKSEFAKKELESKRVELESRIDELTKAGTTTTDGERTIEGAVSAGTDVLETGVGMAAEPGKEGVAGEDIQAEEVLATEKPTPTKLNVLGESVNMYNNYIPSRIEDVEADAMYSFSSDSKDGIPSLLQDKAYANSLTVNGVKKENWNASISGNELLKLFPKKTTEAATQAPLEEQQVPEEITNEYLLKTLPEEKSEGNTGKVMITTDKFGSTKTRYIPFEIIEQANKNDKLGGQTAKEINDRGGYSDKELDRKLPNWRTMLSKPEVVSEKVTEVTAPAIEVTPTAGSVGVGGEVEVRVSVNQKNGVGEKLQDGEKRYDIIKDGIIEGDIIVADKKELGHYEVVRSNVKNQNKGIGTKAYKKLIATLDKPLHSDMARTPQAERLWAKLEKEGLAKKSKDGIVYESLPKEQSLKETPTTETKSTELAAKAEPTKEAAKTDVKDGVTELFKAIPELSDIGSQQEYTKYLDTIFPNSKIKDILYHKTSSKEIEGGKFRVSRLGGVYFSFLDISTGGLLKGVVQKLINEKTVFAVVNIKNPFIVNRKNYKEVENKTGVSTQNVNMTKKYYDLSNNDAILGYANPLKDKGELDDFPNTNLSENGKHVELAVINPDNIHILGSKQDLDGFKKFTSKNTETAKKTTKPEAKKSKPEQIGEGLLDALGLAPVETDVKFSKTTGQPQVLTPTEDKEQEIIDQMNKMSLVNKGIDLNPSFTTKETIDVTELNSRLDNPLESVNWEKFKGMPFGFTISDQLRTGDVTSTSTGVTIENLKGGIGFNGTEGNENNAWANTRKTESNSMYSKALDMYNNNKPLFEKLWKEGKLPDGHVPFAVVKMAESSILSNEAIRRAGIENLKTLPEKNRQAAVVALKSELERKKKQEGEDLVRGTKLKKVKGTPKGVTEYIDTKIPYSKNTKKQKAKAISQYDNVLNSLNKNNYSDIVDVLKNTEEFSLPEKALIFNEIFYGKPNKIGEESVKPGIPSTLVSKTLVEGLDKSKRELISIGVIADLLTEPSMKNVPNMHVISIIGIKVAEKNKNGKWVKAGGPTNVDHPNYEYGVEGQSIGILTKPIHMKDAFGEAYGSALGQVVKNEAKKSSISIDNLLTQSIPVQAGLPNRVLKSAIANEELDAVDKLAGFLRQAFPGTTFFTSEDAWDAAMEDPSIKKKLKDGDVVYAFTTDGNVFINPTLKTTKATLHETGHIWMGFVKENNPALHAKGLELVTGTKEHQKAIKEYGDTELAREEALMELMSSKGDTIVNASQKAKFKEWLLSVYKYIADNFTSLLGLSPKQIEDLTLDKFLEGMLADVLSGKELTTKKIKGEVKFSRESQDARIKEFIDAQRKAGQSDKDIKAGLELVADKVGLTPEDINNLMGVESDEAKPKKGYTPKKKRLEPAQEPEAEKTGTRAFAAKSVERAGVPIEDIPASLKNYRPTTVEEQQKIAEAFIRKHGIDNTITALRLPDSGIDPKSKPVLASVLLKELYAEQNNTTDIAEIEKIAIDVHNVLDSVLTAATEAAQFMAMMREFYNSNPYNYVAQVTRLIEKNINNPIKANVATAVVDINKANKDAAAKAASNVVNEVVTSKVTSAKEKFERSKANLKALWKKSFNVGIAANQYEAAKNDVQFAKALTIMAKDFVVYQSVQFGEFLKEVASQIGLNESDIDKDHLRKIFEKAKSERIQAGIKVGLKELELKLKDLIESHYSSTELEGKLIDKLKSELGVGSEFGLNDAAIKELENAIKREIKVLTAKEKIKALKALGIKEQKDVNEILSLSEEGLLDDNAILETLGDKLGIKKLTPEEAAKLADLAKDINESKEDRIKARNIQKFEDYKFVLAKKYKIQDFLISNYLTNIFGSLTSNEKNIAGNVSETILLVGELMGNALASGNPKDIQRALKALVDGNIRGFDFTKEVITTGVASYKEPGDIRARNMWELIMDRENDLTRVERNLQKLFTIPYLGPVLLAERRFWNRALLSMDSLSGTTNNELGSLLAATREADKQKLRGAKRTKFIEEQMANSAEAQEEARNYAISAGYKEGTGEFNRAVANYLVSKRPEAIKKAAAEYSARATLTQNPPPSTMTGAIANGLNDVISKNPNIKFFVPVVNTFANLIVKNIERSPFEFFSLAFDAGRAASGVESAKAGLTKAEVARRMKTAAVWTAISVLLFALAGGTDDDEEGFEVFGSGTGDPAVDKARRALGWKPNTIRFSKDGGYYNFEFLPFGFVLGMIGNMRDYFKYKNKPAFAIRQAQAKKIFGKNLDALDKNEREQLEAELAIPGKYNISAQEKKEFANLSSELALTPVTYSFQLLKSLGELVNAVGEGAGAINTAMKSITNISRGLAAPRYLGEVRDIFDNKLYDSKEFRNVIGANVPGVTLGNVRLDAFGREIEKYKSESILSGIKYALTRGFYNPPTITELDQFLWENGVGVSVPSNTPSMAYTEDVYREYIVTRGKILITNLTEALKNKEFEGLSPQDVLEVVNIYATNANAEARYITDEKLDKLK